MSSQIIVKNNDTDWGARNVGPLCSEGLGFGAQALRFRAWYSVIRTKTCQPRKRTSEFWEAGMVINS